MTNSNSNSIRSGADRNAGIKAFAFGVAASLAFTLVLSSADKAETAQAPEIVKLERVVISGKRLQAADADAQFAEIKQLPRVVIEGRSIGSSVQLATDNSCKDTGLC